MYPADATEVQAQCRVSHLKISIERARRAALLSVVPFSRSQQRLFTTFHSRQSTREKQSLRCRKRGSTAVSQPSERAFTRSLEASRPKALLRRASSRAASHRHANRSRHCPSPKERPGTRIGHLRVRKWVATSSSRPNTRSRRQPRNGPSSGEALETWSRYGGPRVWSPSGAAGACPVRYSINPPCFLDRRGVDSPFAPSEPVETRMLSPPWGNMRNHLSISR